MSSGAGTLVLVRSTSAVEGREDRRIVAEQKSVTTRVGF